MIERALDTCIATYILDALAFGRKVVKPMHTVRELLERGEISLDDLAKAADELLEAARPLEIGAGIYMILPAFRDLDRDAQTGLLSLLKEGYV